MWLDTGCATTLSFRIINIVFYEGTTAAPPLISSFSYKPSKFEIPVKNSPIKTKHRL